MGNSWNGNQNFKAENLGMSRKSQFTSNMGIKFFEQDFQKTFYGEALQRLIRLKVDGKKMEKV